MHLSLVRLFNQIPKLKYVIAKGACIITRGLFNTNLNSMICGVDKFVWA
jgi:NAD(P)H-quinone oxidoreductase subunit K